MIVRKPIKKALHQKRLKWLISLNAFLCLTIFSTAQESFPLLIESTGALDLNLMDTTASGNIIVAGTFTSSMSYGGKMLTSAGEEDIFLLALSSGGTLLWLKNYGGLFDDDVAVLKAEGEQIWLSGGFRDEAVFDTLSLSTPDGSRSLFVLELDMEGRIRSHQQYDSPGLKSITGIERGGADLYLGGYFQGELSFRDTSLQARGTTDAFLLKMDEKRELVWAFQAGLAGSSRIEQLQLDSEEKLIIAGTYDDRLVLGEDTLRANTTDKDAFVAKLNTEKQVLWSLKAGGVFDKELVSLKTDENGNIYGGGQLVGVMRFSEDLSIESQNGNTDIYWFQLDKDGNPLQAHAYGGPQAERLTDLLLAPNAIWVSGIFQGQFALDNQFFDAGPGVGSFVIELDPQQQQLRTGADIPSTNSVFINQVLLRGNDLLMAGSFGGPLQLGGQLLDAGAYFFGLLTSLKGLTTGLRDIQSFDLRIYPIPFDRELFWESERNIKQVLLYDRSGRLRWRGIGPDHPLQLPLLESGAYMVLFEATDGSIEVQWCIKK